MKKTIIKYTAIITAMTIVISGSVLALKLASADAEIGDEDTLIADSLGEYDNCTHDESYEEPELKVGKYYYNGDTSAKYIEVTGDGKLYYRGGTPEDFAADVLGDGFEQAKIDNKEAINELVEFYSQPREYLVDTLHLLNDKIYVYEEWSITENNDEEIVTGTGFVLEDENTLRKNDFTRFIYIDNPQ